MSHIGKTMGTWECSNRCIVQVRFELTELKKQTLLTVFARRLHNTAASAQFYHALKSSVMQWKFRLIVATKTCNVIVKKLIRSSIPLKQANNLLIF